MSVDQRINPYRHSEGLLHRFDPRLKLCLGLAYILTINLIPSAVWVIFPLLFSINLSLVVLSEIGIGRLLKRSLWILPFMLAVIPLLFQVEGPAWFQFKFFGWQLTASWPGFERGLSIVLKAWFSVQVAIILVSTTPFEGILLGLRWLRVPKLLVVVIGLMWRYLFVLLDEVQRLITARAARSSTLPHIRSGGNFIWRARVTGYMAGSLFLRSLERSDRVYAAMLSRGYDGEVRLWNDKTIPSRDVYILIVGLAVCGLLVISSLYVRGIY